MGYDCEIALVAMAHAKDLLTTPYVFDEDQARAMVEAGADIVVAHMGLTTGGAIGAATAMTLATAAERVQAIATAARAVRSDIVVLCHGGPISGPEDAAYVLGACPDCHGFYGASSMERLPTETAIVAQTRAFKDIRRAAPAE